MPPSRATARSGGAAAPFFGAGCDYFRFELRRSDDRAGREEVDRLLGGASGGTCAAINGYGALLAALSRGFEAGSWLWIVSGDR